MGLLGCGRAAQARADAEVLQPRIEPSGHDLALALFAYAIKAVCDASRCPRHDRLVRGRLERIPRAGLAPWLIAAALGLASAAAAGLKAPNWVWIVALVAAVLFAIVGIVLLFVHVPAAPASLSRNPSDLALRIGSELEDANDHIGIALMRGELWLPAHGPQRSVWDAREAALLAFGAHFYQPARDAYRKIGEHQLDAENAEAAEYAAVGGELVADGRTLTAKTRTELEETRSVIAHALDRLAELEGPRRLVTDDHRDALRAMLDAARASVESHTARPGGEPLDHEMFEAHYRELDAWLTDWDDVVERNSSAPLALRRAIAARLSARQLDHAPYIPDAIVEGFALITERRSLEGRLIEPLFPAIGDRSVFRGFASEEHGAGMVDFIRWAITRCAERARHGTRRVPDAEVLRGRGRPPAPTARSAHRSAGLGRCERDPSRTGSAPRVPSGRPR